MRGYIREYRPGKWSFTVDVGKVNGKRKKIERGGYASKHDAEAALNKKLVELDESGTVFIPSEKTVAEVYEEYMDTVRFTCAPSTLRVRKTIYTKHIEKDLGYRYIRTLKTSDIDNIIKKNLDAGYSNESVSNVKKTISGILRYAIDHGYIKTNPMQGTIEIKHQNKPIEVLTEDEIKQVIDLTRNTNFLPVIMIGIYTGMRAGEITGLRWQDVDLNHMTISINRQLINEKDRFALCSCKCNSERLIHIPHQLANYLVTLKAQQDEYKDLLGKDYHRFNVVYNYLTKRKENIEDFVVVKKDGKLMHRNSLIYINEKCRKHGIDFHLHKMRHTYATTLLEAGCSLKMLQEALGHRSSTVTLAIYSHVTEQHAVSVVDRLPTY